MIVIGSIATLAIFLFVGWAVSTEMFQQRAWRKRVESGDVADELIREEMELHELRKRLLLVNDEQIGRAHV